ncbi:NAD-dependent epimerase/dehydratase family protein [Empedobacter falsenii]|uniref:NAD-dependent epimerase/dehydratase family protein n=1 Tax=Empedobacter falsenii TaxID=343874 RepID=A0AAW7DPR6_9FLAO|nr:NAD-dependent epimerase/dehydratase family protein [Empedobacter falsenii]MDM1552256.1 NAD-dependent epimerase/dehydratase family protein [Empedobacter falsenii]
MILITGASGFVGTNLSAYLKNHHHSIESLSLRGDRLSRLDSKVDAVIHLAGKAHDLENVSDESEYFKVNRDLTIELFNEFLKSEIKDFFFFSSVKAVADTADEIVKEDIVPNPLTPYGKSKFEAEQYLLAQKLPAEKRLFIIRPCMIHGPGNKGNLNLLYKVVEKGIPWPLSKFDNSRSFLSIDNLSYLVLEMLTNRNVQSGIYNFSDDQFLSTNELIIAINKALGRKAKFLPIPKGLIQAVAKCGDVIRFPLNSERIKKLTENYVVSNQKIKTALNIKQLPLSAEEGIIKTIKSFKRN